MSDRITTVELRVNDHEAKNRLEELDKEARKLRQSMQSAYEAGDTKKIEAFQKKLGKVSREMSDIQQRSAGIRRAMDNLSLAKPRELRNLVKSLNKELNSGSIVRGSKECAPHLHQH